MGEKPLDTNLLFRRWIHSHEEDTESQEVYRPATFSFPPARGRSGFELRADHSCIYVGIGRGDGEQEIDGSWRYEGESERDLRIDCAGVNRAMHIAVLEEDKLVVSKET